MTNEKFDAQGVRLSKEAWQNVWNNTNEAMQEAKDAGDEDYMYQGIEVTWLDGSDEYILNVGEEVLEDGFTSEEEAQARLTFVEQNYIVGEGYLHGA